MVPVPIHQPALVMAMREEVIVCAASLHVFKRHIVLLRAGGVRMADIGEHLFGCRADIDLAMGNPQRPGQRNRLFARLLARGKAGQREGDNVLAGEAQPVKQTRAP